MKIVDADILIYAINAGAPPHAQAKAWLESTLSGHETVGLPWNVLLAAIRLMTRTGAFRDPIPLEHCFRVVDSWLDRPSVTVVHPGPRHLRVLRDLLLPLGTGGNLTSDAHLGALAIEQGAELCSCDGDFARFPGLLWRNPIA